jgi:2-amino-4-hydroxy-6-hydroxymethyldihydropteridine diphosphokinase
MILLNIGSNLSSIFGNRFKNIKRAIGLLNLEEIKIIKESNFYETPSYPNKELPKFVNICLEVKCDFTSIILLKKIKKIEKKMFRKKNGLNNPRTCDIDIIDFHGQVLNNKELNLPHPRLNKRNFVLYPLFQIHPNWKHPITNEKIDVLIRKLSAESRNEITRLNETDIIN